MDKRFKVVWTGRVPTVEEIKELAKVNAELVEVDCITEDEVI